MTYLPNYEVVALKCAWCRARRPDTEPFTMPSPEAFHEFLNQELEHWGKLAKDSSAKAE